jgi:hypothetical protein
MLELDTIDDTQYAEFLERCSAQEAGKPDKYEVFFSCSDCSTTFTVNSPQIITALFRAEEKKCPGCGGFKNIKLTGHKVLDSVEDVLKGEVLELNNTLPEERMLYRETTYRDVLMWATFGNLYY